MWTVLSFVVAAVHAAEVCPYSAVLPAAASEPHLVASDAICAAIDHLGSEPVVAPPATRPPKRGGAACPGAAIHGHWSFKRFQDGGPIFEYTAPRTATCNFTQFDRDLARKCLHGRRLVFVGQSLMRYHYLGFVYLLTHGIPERVRSNATGLNAAAHAPKGNEYRSPLVGKREWGDDWDVFFRGVRSMIGDDVFYIWGKKDIGSAFYRNQAERLAMSYFPRMHSTNPTFTAADWCVEVEKLNETKRRPQLPCCSKAKHPRLSSARNVFGPLNLTEAFRAMVTTLGTLADADAVMLGPTHTRGWIPTVKKDVCDISREAERSTAPVGGHVWWTTRPPSPPSEHVPPTKEVLHGNAKKRTSGKQEHTNSYNERIASTTIIYAEAHELKRALALAAKTSAESPVGLWDRWVMVEQLMRLARCMAKGRDPHDAAEKIDMLFWVDNLHLQPFVTLELNNVWLNQVCSADGRWVNDPHEVPLWPEEEEEFWSHAPQDADLRARMQKDTECAPLLNGWWDGSHR
jgi:hypothetical protein